MSTAINIMTNARQKGLLKIPVGQRQKRIRTVSFVAGAGTSMPGTVGRRFGPTSPPTSGTTMWASARSSSRSQLAAHSAQSTKPTAGGPTIFLKK